MLRVRATSEQEVEAGAPAQGSLSRAPEPPRKQGQTWAWLGTGGGNAGQELPAERAIWAEVGQPKTGQDPGPQHRSTWQRQACAPGQGPEGCTQAQEPRGPRPTTDGSRQAGWVEAAQAQLPQEHQGGQDTGRAGQNPVPEDTPLGPLSWSGGTEKASQAAWPQWARTLGSTCGSAAATSETWTGRYSPRRSQE